MPAFALDPLSQLPNIGLVKSHGRQLPRAKMRYAVVTGANKGIGYEICRQLASKGVTVVLTARDETRGLGATEKLKASGFPELVAFHQLDVRDPASIAALAAFVKNQFGKLDILVNNAGIIGRGASTEAYEVAEDCLQTNYYGAKRMVEAFIPLLQQSDSPRIVNVSSSMGLLKNISNKWAVEVLSNVERLTEEKVDEVLMHFLKDFKDGSLAAKGWPTGMSAYIVSKAAMNAYTRILAKKYHHFCINSVCPGYVKTDMNNNTGFLTVEEGAEGPVKLALLPEGGPSGLFFNRNKVSPF